MSLISLSERTLEDHEKVLECIHHWPRTSNNSILFKNNPEKYYIIKRPQLLMPSSHAYSSVNPQRSNFTEQQKKNIILKVHTCFERNEGYSRAPCLCQATPWTNQSVLIREF